MDSFEIRQIMNNEIDYYCGLYVDASSDENSFSSELASTFGISSDKWNDIETSVGNIYVVKNDEFDEKQRKDIDDGFLFYKYKLEIEPKPSLNKSQTIEFISKILEHCWSQGYPAVASCDYEDLLPEKGGYKSPNIPKPQ